MNKLLKMQIVESASVVNWLLGKDMTDDFMRCVLIRLRLCSEMFAIPKIARILKLPNLQK